MILTCNIQCVALLILFGSCGAMVTSPLRVATRISSLQLSNDKDLTSSTNTSIQFDDTTSLEENGIFPSGIKALEEVQQITTVRRRLFTDRRVHMTVPELIRYSGYGAEVHHVTTEDGYILELHRVVAKSSNNCTNIKRKKKSYKKKVQCQPVFLQHGLLGSSSAWILNEPSKALAYILADRGYDVWLGNSRGNIYSMNHTKLDVKSKEFWDFSFDEMGKYDLPAVITYVKRVNTQKKLHYVGHSMGTTMFWVFENSNPQLAESSIASMTGIGPVAFVGHARSPIVLLAPFSREINWFLTKVVHEYRIMNPNFIITRFTEELCSSFKLAELVCSNSIFLLIGFDNKDLDMDWMPVIMSQLNAGTSTRTLVHFAQMIHSNTFSAFDFGSGNKERYNQTEPPTYDLSAVRVPVLLKWGRNDWLADPTDVERLHKGLKKSKVTCSPVSNPDFNHLDFLWGRDAAKVVYRDVWTFIEKHL